MSRPKRSITTFAKWLENRKKSFHADTYCFDSIPEKKCFMQYITSAKVAEAEDLVADVYAEYDRLCQLSSQTIRDYQNEIYNNYIKTTAVDNSSEMLMWAIKLCIFLVLGLCLSCAVCLLSDRRRAKRDASERG